MSAVNSNGVTISERKRLEEFQYVGPIKLSGWKEGELPIVFDWPENVDVQSTVRKFQTGKEYTIGSSSRSDIVVKHFGICDTHLKVEVLTALSQEIVLIGR